jgi:radical SAM superfamily enzyme YgiQ (UPF0313 family)
VLPTHYATNGKLLTVKKASLNLNLSLPTLASLTPPDWEVRIVHDYMHPVDLETPGDLVAMTVLTAPSSRAYELADQFRARGRKVVFGGFHVWARPDEAAQHADAIVIGEAEDLWPAVLDDFLAGRLKDRYVSAGPVSLAGRPAPRYELVDKRDYKVEVYPIESSRGCPYNCDYCAVTAFHGGRHRLRPVGDVLRNIRATGSRYIAFADDNLCADRDHALEMFRELAKLDIRFMAQSTMYIADDPELLDAAIKGGLRMLWVGVESIQPEALDEVHRRINQVEEFGRRIEEFNKRGLLVGTNLIFGFDHNTRETFDATYDFLMSHKVFPFLYILTPVPGTRLWDRIKGEGRLLSEDWRQYTGYDVVFQPKNFSPDELRDLYFKTVARLFSVRNNLRRHAPRIQWHNLKETFFTQVAGFAVATQVGYAARHRIPEYW